MNEAGLAQSASRRSSEGGRTLGLDMLFPRRPPCIIDAPHQVGLVPQHDEPVLPMLCLGMVQAA